MKTNKFGLPEQIQIKILEHTSGMAYFAELPEFDVFTEADSLEDLGAMINDLIYELFDVPKKIQHQIKYAPSKTHNLSKQEKLLDVMMTPELYRNHYHVA